MELNLLFYNKCHFDALFVQYFMMKADSQISKPLGPPVHVRPWVFSKAPKPFT